MEEGADETRSPRGAGRGRVGLIAAVVVVVVLIATVVIVLSGGGEGDDPGGAADATTALSDPPAAECIEAWNDASEMVTIGAHMKVDHDVPDVWVTYLAFDGTPAAGDDQAECAVIFPLQGFADLGKELENVVKLFKGRAEWFPYSELGVLTPAEISELRTEAVEKVNAELADDGTITELPQP